ncbi:MAG: hypothetical protein H0X30_12570 [Anaerolineae bacterium]|nr:hypothetical protein [Anaerolineae bacterium]
MSESKSSRFSVRLSPDEDLRLQQLADDWQVKRSMAVRLLIQRTIQPLTSFIPVGVFTPVGDQQFKPMVIGGDHEEP